MITGPITLRTTWISSKGVVISPVIGSSVGVWLAYPALDTERHALIGLLARRMLRRSRGRIETDMVLHKLFLDSTVTAAANHKCSDYSASIGIQIRCVDYVVRALLLNALRSDV